MTKTPIQQSEIPSKNHTLGRFITFEGIDGSGKSAHSEWYAQKLSDYGVTARCTREPGGTPLAEKIRDLLLTNPMCLEAEIFLIFAARQDHINKFIHPVLMTQEWVICERFMDSTYAYQVGGRGADAALIELLEKKLQNKPQPIRTYLFEIATEIALQRRHIRGGKADRFEQENLDFFKRVNQLYKTRAASEPNRFFLIDANLSVQEIRQQLSQDIFELISRDKNGIFFENS